MLNEFRQDPVSSDWVLFSTARGRKPQSKEAKPFYQTKEECYFEPEKLADQKPPISWYRKGERLDGPADDWTTIVLPNKFPALEYGMCGPATERGPFLIAAGAGFHELVVTRDHEKHFADFTDAETAEVLNAYRDRYAAIARDNCGEYVMIFHNHGLLAGASVFHNHSQIMSTPIIPSGILKNIKAAQDYFVKTGARIHEIILDWEIKEDKRVIYENEKFVALCPYVSRTAYEVRIFPKSPSAYFGDLSESDVPALAQALNAALKKIFRALGNVDYNFFIHTAPPQKPDSPIYDAYHWHIEVMPRFSIDAGLEFGTNVFVNTIDPDEAAELLRNTAI